MATTYLAHLREYDVDSRTGTVIPQNASLLARNNSKKEWRVVPDTNPNTASYPTLDEYIALEDADGRSFHGMIGTAIVVTKDQVQGTLSGEIAVTNEVSITGNVGVTNEVSVSGAVGIADGANLDAFSRLRVSDAVGIFDSTFQYDLQPLTFFQSTANGGVISHAPNLASAKLDVTTTANSVAIIQSKAYHRYIPAKSQMIVMTQVLGAASNGVRKRVGYFDANDGIFLEQLGGDNTTEVAITRRTSTGGAPSDTDRVIQEDWNLDTLDGNGPSGITLDLTKSSILFIDLQWLGMGRVRIGFDINGKLYYVHEFRNANNLSVPYMKTANLPVRWEIQNTGSSSGTMYATCSAVASEGGTEFNRGYQFGVRSNSTTAQTTRTAVVAIRPKTTFGGITNRIQIDPQTMEALVTGNSPVLWEIVYNPTLTGGTWIDADASNSSAEYNTSATTITGGVLVDSFYTPATAQSKSSGNAYVLTRYPIVLDMSGSNPIPVVLAATGLGGSSAVYGSMTWKELR